MGKLICENCGQEYDSKLNACPLCGHINEDLGIDQMDSVITTASVDNADVIKKQRQRQRDMKRVPTGLVIAICICAGLLILLTLVYILSSGVFQSNYHNESATAEQITQVDTNDSAMTDDAIGTTSSGETQKLATSDPEENSEADPPSPETSDMLTDDAQSSVSTADATGSGDANSGVPIAEIDASEKATENTASGAETDSESAESNKPQDNREKTINVACESISINREDITLSSKGEHFTFDVVVSPSEAAENVTWVSSNETMVTVSDSGTITARSGTGNDYVTITASCGDKSAVCIVRCSFEMADQLLFLDKDDITMFYSGETARLLIENDDLDEEDLDSIRWTTSDATVAGIDNSGTITAISGGIATITAELGDRSGSCIVRCSFGGSAAVGSEAESSAWSLSHSDVTMTREGEIFRISLVGTGEEPAHIWSTSDTSICTVDSEGLVTAVGNGIATVMTTINNTLYQCVVRVNINSN